MELACGEDLGSYPLNNNEACPSFNPTPTFQDFEQSAVVIHGENGARSTLPCVLYEKNALYSQELAEHPLSVLSKREGAHSFHRIRLLEGIAMPPKMREEVVAWILETSWYLGLNTATASAAVSIFDHFIAICAVTQMAKLHELASSCLVVACKVTDDDEAPIAAIAEQCATSPEGICAMEREVLSVLQWKVRAVTLHDVIAELEGLGHIPLRSSPARQIKMEALMVNSMLEYNLAPFRPTSIGVACGMLVCTTESEMQSLLRLASSCGVDIAEVSRCISTLTLSMEHTMKEGSHIWENQIELECLSSPE